MKFITLEKDYNLKISSKITDYFSPDYIFLPMEKNSEILVKIGQKVSRGELVMENPRQFSSVSGRVVGWQNSHTLEGNKRTLVIENNFQEKPLKIKLTKNLSLRDLEEKINYYEIKYADNFLKFKEILIVNTIENEPYIESNFMWLNKNYGEILDVLELLNSFYNFKKILIVLKNTERENIEKFINVSGKYPFIFVFTLPDIYPLDDDVIYQKTGTSSQEASFISLLNIMEISKILSFKIPLSEVYLTISGSAVKEHQVINVKLGAPLKPLLEKLKLSSTNNLIYLNGLMRGQLLSDESLIVTKNLRGLIVEPKIEIAAAKCSNCGLCQKYCPYGFNPKVLLKKKKTVFSCRNCGICTYLCPSFINLRNLIEKGENDEK